MFQVMIIRAAVFAGLVLAIPVQAADVPSAAFAVSDPRPSAISFRIDQQDIASVHVDGPSLTIRLKPEASKRLAALTADHVGRMLTLYYRDVRVQRAQIQAPVRNGLIYVGNPPEAVKRRIEALADGP